MEQEQTGDDIRTLGKRQKKGAKNGHSTTDKRLKYDILKAFYRTYFTLDSNSMVLKELIFSLYSRKITKDPVARNALYRQMWSYFTKERLSSFQGNYREYIKGIRLNTSMPEKIEDRDLEILRNEGGVIEFFDFTEEDLMNESTEIMSDETSSGSNESILILDQIEQLEDFAKNILKELKELKAELKKQEQNNKKRKKPEDA